MNEPVAAEVEQVWGRSASSGLATGRPGPVLTARSLSLHAREGRADLRSTDRPARAAWAALPNDGARAVGANAGAAAMVRASSARFTYGVFDNSSPASAAGPVKSDGAVCPLLIR